MASPATGDAGPPMRPHGFELPHKPYAVEGVSQALRRVADEYSRVASRCGNRKRPCVSPEMQWALPTTNRSQPPGTE